METSERIAQSLLQVTRTMAAAYLSTETLRLNDADPDEDPFPVAHAELPSVRVSAIDPTKVVQNNASEDRLVLRWWSTLADGRRSVGWETGDFDGVEAFDVTLDGAPVRARIGLYGLAAEVFGLGPTDAEDWAEYMTDVHRWFVRRIERLLDTVTLVARDVVADEVRVLLGGLR